MSRPLIARMLLAVTVMVAAVLLAPSAGWAHAGHDHAKSVSVATTTDEMAASAVDTSHAIEQVQTRVSWVSSGTTKISSANTVVCIGGCCGAATPSCCAISIAEMLGLPVPPSGRAVFAALHLEGAGIIPGTLPEPPKSLV